jgi:glutaredoxin 2
MSIFSCSVFKILSKNASDKTFINDIGNKITAFLNKDDEGAVKELMDKYQLTWKEVGWVFFNENGSKGKRYFYKICRFFKKILKLIFDRICIHPPKKDWGI